MFAGSDFPIAIEQTRLDRTLREMRIPRSKSQREMKQMVELAIKKFRVRWETFEGIKLFKLKYCYYIFLNSNAGGLVKF